MPGMEDGLFQDTGQWTVKMASKRKEKALLCWHNREPKRLFMTSASYRMMYGQGRLYKGICVHAELDPAVLDPAGDMAYMPGRRTNNKLSMDTGSLDGFLLAGKPYDMLGRAEPGD